MLIAQISDCHIREDGRLVYGALDTAPYLVRAVDALNALAPRPDLVLVTGDLVDAGSAAEYSRLRAMLGRLAAPYFLLPGNHDARAALRAAFPDHRYLGGDGGFLHWTIENRALRVVALDSLDPGQVSGLLCSERIAWLDRTLAEARERPTLVAVHHPPFATGIAHMDAKPFRNADAFAAVIARYRQVERVVCGHVHRAMTVRWADTIATSCPATAHQFVLDLKPGSPAAFALEPAGYQLHHWRPGAGLMTHTAAIGDFPPTVLGA